MIGDSSLLKMLTTKMDYLVQRQRVLSENIANSDTPDYQAKDLKPLDFSTVLRGERTKLSMAQTSEAHMAAPGDSDNFEGARSKAVYEVAPDGNGVVLEEQLMKVDATRADYQLATNLFRKYQNLYKMALGRSGGG